LEGNKEKHIFAFLKPFPKNFSKTLNSENLLKKELSESLLKSRGTLLVTALGKLKVEPSQTRKKKTTKCTSVFEVFPE
jgi:hypothetical protein